MPLTSITARFVRRVQVRQFEPMEAEISAVFNIDEGEAVPSAAALLIETKEAVMKGLRHQTAQAVAAADGEAEMTTDPGPAFAHTDPDTVVAEKVTREPGKPSPGKQRRTTAEVAEDDARKLADMKRLADMTDDPAGDLGPAAPDLSPNPDLSPDPGVDEFPTGRTEVAGDPNVADLGPAEAPDPAGPDLSDFDTTEVDPPEAPINDAELLKIATAGATTLGADDVRAIIAGFGVKQLVQLDPDQRATFRTSVTDAIAAAKT